MKFNEDRRSTAPSNDSFQATRHSSALGVQFSVSGVPLPHDTTTPAAGYAYRGQGPPVSQDVELEHANFGPGGG